MIIKEAKGNLTNPFEDILYPDQFVSAAEKQTEKWVKSAVDYYANCAYAQYMRNLDTFVKNYDLVNGILTMEDFYEEPSIKSFTDMLLADVDLPKYVQHYSIFNGPLSSAVGELSRRPDSHKVKAFDAESRSEEMHFRTTLLQQYAYQKIRKSLAGRMAFAGEGDEEDLDRLTINEIQKQISDYTSNVEGWANHTIEALKVAFNMKEQSEEGFRDLFTCGREYFLPIEDNSKLGFNIKGVNPKNAWFHTIPDQKWTKNAYFGGTIEIQEISQIIEEITDLTTEEIDHLREGLKTGGVLGTVESNYGKQSVTGIDSIKYSTYSPAVVQEQLLAESQMAANNAEGLSHLFGLGANVGAFGQKYVVIRIYFLSKMKVKNVAYLDENGEPQTMLVDENYKTGDIPTEFDVEEGWINQWYEAIKIGPDVYKVKPYKLLDRFPLIGINYNIRNSEVRAPIDFLKPFQAIYNLCMNQLWELLGKEKGQVLKIQLRRIPVPKDGDPQDALEQWMQDAEERGIVFEDDSPENLKTPMANTTVTQTLDWSLTKQIQSRYELAAMIKNEAYELIGFSRQRLASVQATETATATNTAIAQSYAQTEPLFSAHDYLLNQVYQAAIDCAQYTQSQKPTSTISYITSMGEAASIEVTGEDLRARDLWVFDTSRPQDQEMFNKLQELAQPYMQNGGDLSEVVELFTNRSIRSLKKVFDDFKAKRDAMMQQEQQMKQAELEQKQAFFEAQQKAEAERARAEMINENINKEKDRQMQIEKAIITALGIGKNTGADTNADSIPDIYETTELLQKADEISKKHDAELQKLALERDKLNQENINKEKDRQIERENMKNDLQIAKQNAKGRAKSKPKK